VHCARAPRRLSRGSRRRRSRRRSSRAGGRERVEREIATLGLQGEFSAVVCGEDARDKKPHPEALHAALARLATSSAEAVYVGDSPEDVHMARAAGVFVIGVDGGFPNAAALRDAGPDILARDLARAVEALIGPSPSGPPHTIAW
jgi:phosphoglycolate phosphatase-like HAD superfamily hydrolase